MGLDRAAARHRQSSASRCHKSLCLAHNILTGHRRSGALAGLPSVTYKRQNNPGPRRAGGAAASSVVCPNCGALSWERTSPCWGGRGFLGGVPQLRGPTLGKGLAVLGLPRLPRRRAPTAGPYPGGGPHRAGATAASSAASTSSAERGSRPGRERPPPGLVLAHSVHPSLQGLAQEGGPTMGGGLTVRRILGLGRGVLTVHRGTTSTVLSLLSVTAGATGPPGPRRAGGAAASSVVCPNCGALPWERTSPCWGGRGFLGGVPQLRGPTLGEGLAVLGLPRLPRRRAPTAGPYPGGGPHRAGATAASSAASTSSAERGSRPGRERPPPGLVLAHSVHPSLQGLAQEGGPTMGGGLTVRRILGLGRGVLTVHRGTTSTVLSLLSVTAGATGPPGPRRAGGAAASSVVCPNCGALSWERTSPCWGGRGFLGGVPQLRGPTLGEGLAVLGLPRLPRRRAPTAGPYPGGGPHRAGATAASSAASTSSAERGSRPGRERPPPGLVLAHSVHPSLQGLAQEGGPTMGGGLSVRRILGLGRGVLTVHRGTTSTVLSLLSVTAGATGPPGGGGGRLLHIPL
ncbi:translation initiation factor IF-2-like [Eriocheir sinensis]|uniref:translation initiation factor IF-2-like n=1 Tax=Eriocheir sinensis TaxID=95602 RepID=UPI0021C77FC3|nr:translation initiation factor IF-2-like [Eriocheir sinensis]